MDNNLEEIRKRDHMPDRDEGPYFYHYHIACADRRWLLGEVEWLREALHKIADNYYDNDINRKIARRALAEEEK